MYMYLDMIIQQTAWKIQIIWIDPYRGQWPAPKINSGNQQNQVAKVVTTKAYIWNAHVMSQIYEP